MERSINLVLPRGNGQNASAAGDGASTVYAELRPAVGNLYIVDFAGLIHDDDAASRICAWLWYDGVTYTPLHAYAAFPLNTYQYLYEDLKLPHPLVCSYTSYLVASCVAPQAPHKVYLNYVVRKLHGVEPWLDA